jgi:hypothetical protein
MRRSSWGLLGVWLMFGGMAAVRADDTSPQAILDRAVEAEGGAAKLTQQKAISWKGKGTFYGLGMPIEFTGDWDIQPPKQMRNVIEIDVNGMKIQITTILNGDKGWVVTMGNTEEMNADQLASAQEEMYAGRVATLVVLKEPKYKLSPLGESKVGDKPVVGVKVSSEGHKDIKLYFDKKTGLMIRSERKAKDPMAGQEYTQDTYYSDFQDFGGIKRNKKLTIKRDGNDFVTMEITDYKMPASLPAKLFQKPGE